LSPPTQDQVTHAEKASADISRLRAEIIRCLQQIKACRLDYLHKGTVW